MKIPDPRFKRYRIRLREEGGHWFSPSQWKENELVWGKPIQLYEFTEYEAEELATRSPFRLSVFWKFWGNDRKLEIWGQLEADDTWVPISPWLLKEQRANEHREVPARLGDRIEPAVSSSLPANRPSQDRLYDEAHAACVEALISKLRSDGHEPRTEGTYSRFGERGSVDVYCFGRAYKSSRERRTNCAIYEVWTEIDKALRKLDEKARVYPEALAEAHGLQRPSLTQAHFVVLATRQNLDLIADHWQTFRAKFADKMPPGKRLLLQVFDPVAGELEVLAPKPSGTSLDDQTLRRWARYPSKSAFIEAWRKKSVTRRSV